MRDKPQSLEDKHIKAFGISYDTAQEHKDFRAKFQLTTPLLMDTEKTIGAAYGINTSGYPDRKTFVIDKDGTLRAILEKIDFEDHASQIARALDDG